jgi:hypothetical protein
MNTATAADDGIDEMNVPGKVHMITIPHIIATKNDSTTSRSRCHQLITGLARAHIGRPHPAWSTGFSNDNIDNNDINDEVEVDNNTRDNDDAVLDKDYDDDVNNNKCYYGIGCSVSVDMLTIISIGLLNQGRCILWR